MLLAHAAFVSPESSYRNRRSNEERLVTKPLEWFLRESACFLREGRVLLQGVRAGVSGRQCVLPLDWGGGSGTTRFGMKS